MSLSYGFYQLLKEMPNKIYSIFIQNIQNTQNDQNDQNIDIEDDKSFYKKLIQLLYYNYAYGDT